MDQDTREFIKFIAFIALACFALLLILSIIVFPISWYASGIQQQVWERQGIHLTHWEVFMGAHPAKVVQP